MPLGCIEFVEQVELEGSHPSKGGELTQFFPTNA